MSDLKLQLSMLGVLVGVYLLLANSFGAGLGLFLMLIFCVVLNIFLDIVLLLLRDAGGNIRGSGVLGLVLALLVGSVGGDE